MFDKFPANSLIANKHSNDLIEFCLWIDLPALAIGAEPHQTPLDENQTTRTLFTDTKATDGKFEARWLCFRQADSILLRINRFNYLRNVTQRQSECQMRRVGSTALGKQIPGLIL